RPVFRKAPSETSALLPYTTLFRSPGEVLIRVRACSINYRDFAVAAGKYFGGALKAPAVPLSDGAGEVVSVGAGVTRFKAGDRVQDRKSTRNSSHVKISYAVFCLKK